MIIRRIQILGALPLLLVAMLSSAQPPLPTLVSPPPLDGDAPCASSAECGAFIEDSLENGLNLEETIQQLIDQGVTIETAVAAAKQVDVPGVTAAQITTTIAAALTDRGQTPAQITAVLVQTGSSAAEATVAVRTAVPTASTAQLNAGLAAAGVTAAEAQAAVAAAPQQQAAAPATNTGTAAVVTGAGLLVGADGKAVVVASEKDQLNAVIAFVVSNPSLLDKPETQKGVANIIGSALSAATGGQLGGAETVQTITNSLSQAGGTTSSFLTALTDALAELEETTGVDLEDVQNEVAENPAQDNASPS